MHPDEESCSFADPDPIGSDQHSKSIGGQEFEFCPACNFSTISRAEIVSHMAKSHPNQITWSCRACQFSTENVEEMLKHSASAAEKHSTSIQSPHSESVYVLKELKCKLCDFRY